MFQCHCSLRGIQNIIQNEDKLSGFVVQDGHIYMNYYRDDTDSGTTIDVVYENTSKVMPVKGKRSVELSLTQPCVDECQILVCHHTNASCWAGSLSKAEVETDKILGKVVEFSGSIDNISPDESQMLLVGNGDDNANCTTAVNLLATDDEYDPDNPVTCSTDHSNPAATIDWVVEADDMIDDIMEDNTVTEIINQGAGYKKISTLALPAYHFGTITVRRVSTTHNLDHI